MFLLQTRRIEHKEREKTHTFIHFLLKNVVMISITDSYWNMNTVIVVDLLYFD